MSNTHCEHNPRHIVSLEDGTQYCEACEQEVRQMNQEDALAPSMIDEYKKVLLSSENPNQLARIGLRLAEECENLRAAFDVLEVIRTNLEAENFKQHKALMRAEIDMAKMRHALGTYADESNWNLRDHVYFWGRNYLYLPWEIAQNALAAVEAAQMEDER